MTLASQLQNAETGEILVARLEIARTLWQSAVGLIGRARLAPDAALWLHPCNAIHTFGLRFAIDVLFLDREDRVVRAVSGLRPCRICGPVWEAKSVVELPGGALQRLAVPVGTRVRVVAV